MGFLLDQIRGTVAQLDTLAKSSDAPDAPLVREACQSLMAIGENPLDPKIAEAFAGISAADVLDASESAHKA